MRTFTQVYAALRRKNKGQYALLTGCCFFSVLLITAYVCMMRSPTILSVLPEGGDSRKQVMMIFALAVIGCAVFTTYAAGLFFRQKSRETGVFLALGASRTQLKTELRKDLAVISAGSCAAGAVLGGPLAWAIWTLFRLFLVDSQEMPLSLDPGSYLLALAFAVYVTGMLFLLGGRSVRKTNIIDIVQESHRSEPIREVKGWYGWVGIVLLAVGGLAGYLMPSFFVTVLHWYAPAVVDGVFYLPALAGLYMILLHTVVNGWRGRRRTYKDIISVSQMRFQGRQTVRNMLVMTLLIAGAYFASFYAPMLSTSSAYGFDSRPVDFEYHWRCDQDIPERGEVEALAEEYGVTLTSWAQTDAALLGRDGITGVETDNGVLGTTYTEEYREILGSARFFSESAWRTLTGQTVDLAPGTCANVLDDEGGSEYLSGGDVTHLTNMVTGAELDVEMAEPLQYTMLLGCYVLDDADYAAITAGLTDPWRETCVFFNVADVDASYPFAKALFNEIVDRSGLEVMQMDAYDPAAELLAEAAGEEYGYNREHVAANGFSVIDPADRDSSEFRNYWLYMPQFRVLDHNDFVTTMAVFLMLFIFIALICFAAVFVIAYTRCMTIGLTNRQVYDDLRHLGAPGGYLFRSVRSQVSKVFLVPALVGTALISAFYFMIMYFNDNRITAGEVAGMALCAVVIIAVSAVFYGAYRLTRRSVCGVLEIRRNRH